MIMIKKHCWKNLGKKPMMPLKEASAESILNSFRTVNKYKIDQELIDAFFHSMEMDLTKQDYNNDEEYSEYIYGSAEVVGLMCLMYFVKEKGYYMSN